MGGHCIKYDGVVEVWKISWPFPAVPWYGCLNSTLKRACLWYLIRPSCWGMRKLTLCAYSCRLQLLFILARSMVIYKYPATCLHLFEWQACSLLFLAQPLKGKWSGRLFKHTHWYSSLSLAQLKWPTILKVVALPNFEYFWNHYKVGYFLRTNLFLPLVMSCQTC